jgi:multidrug resistance efflux pump
MEPNEKADSPKESGQTVETHLHLAEVDTERAVEALSKGQLKKAEDDLLKAAREVKEAEAERRDREIEIKVDGQVKFVKKGTYVVSAFKVLVGVAADRELDIVEHDTLKPLDDSAEITIHQREVFISHPRTGGSSCQ